MARKWSKTSRGDEGHGLETGDEADAQRYGQGLKEDDTEEIVSNAWVRPDCKASEREKC